MRMALCPAGMSPAAKAVVPSLTMVLAPREFRFRVGVEEVLALVKERK